MTHRMIAKSRVSAKREKTSPHCAPRHGAVCHRLANILDQLETAIGPATSPKPPKRGGIAPARCSSKGSPVAGALTPVKAGIVGPAEVSAPGYNSVAIQRLEPAHYELVLLLLADALENKD